MNDTEKERLERYKSAMGVELSQAYAELTQNLTYVRVVWHQYRQLFGTDEETIKLLNRTSGLFFNIVENELWDMVLIAISRISEPKEYKGRNPRKNFNLNSLPELLTDETLRRCVERDLAIVDRLAEDARLHRNRRIAHQDDIYVKTRHEADALPPISRANIEEALHALAKVLNNIERHYLGSETNYSYFITIDGAETLLQKLRRLEELEEQHIGWKRP
ncbi:hypothetical protein [Stenotrophomonas maltophilia]|uniref:AbiU2 domain-containing protein n=1 Tax=Stenotrophomonas maltophilia TaxID=40324 RepID=UPI0039C0D922